MCVYCTEIHSNSKGTEMSFSENIKQELSKADIPAASRDSFIYGLLYGFRSDEPQIITSSDSLCSCIESVFPEVQIETVKLNASSRCIIIRDEDLLQKYSFGSAEINREFVSGNDIQTGIFLRGVFMTCGNASVQKAGYHLELSPRSDKCRTLFNIINEQGMTINLSKRNGSEILVSKNSENISDFLTFIGAMQNSMEIMNIKIYKEFRSSVNRAVNCETANIEKTAAAAAKQILDIKMIEENCGLDTLNEELREIAVLRLENPDISLSGLGKLLEIPISRSGVNHRFEKIAKIADKYRIV